MLETRINKANKTLKIIKLSIIGIVVALIATLSVLLLSGYKVLWVLGDSSVQGIKPFSVILVQPCKVEDLTARDVKNGKMGDFAVRYSGSGFVTHEVVYAAQNEAGVWEFDTQAAGDRGTKTDGANGKFTQKNLAGKVVAQESFIGKILAWIQGYPNIETSLAGNPSKMLGGIRILTLAVILIGISKFADFMAYKESVY